MTEDNGDPGDGFYRCIPHVSGKLHQGGRLEMLAIEGRSKYDTVTGQKVGRTLRCEWVPIEDPDPTDAEKHPEAGDDGKGRIWRYTPKGTKKGLLTLLFESHSGHVLDQSDSLAVSPRGGVVVPGRDLRDHRALDKGWL
jgi:hypothetical protein